MCPACRVAELSALGHFTSHEHWHLSFTSGFSQPIYWGGVATLAVLLPSLFRGRGFGVISILGIGFCRSVYSVVRESHYISRYRLVGWVESLVSRRSIFMFARPVMKWPNQALQRTAADHRGRNLGFSAPLSLSFRR
jgi:hypothetical protein